MYAGVWYTLKYIRDYYWNGLPSSTGSRIGVNTKKKMIVNSYERIIADSVVEPSQMSVSFDMIGGLEKEKQEIFETVILPLKRPDLFRGRGSLLNAPRGVLLFGQPGTGKTMLAKAIAKESGASFLNVHLSTLMNKYFGESNKLVASVFSLAAKMSPCIIFIDEVDAFLRQRGGDCDSAMLSMKAEFMTHWDGLLTDESTGNQVIVLGATNRPYDLDSAILRRMPRTFEIGLPVETQRAHILKLLLKKEAFEGDGGVDELCTKLAKRTDRYSGSDLKELCRAALMNPIREALQQKIEDKKEDTSSSPINSSQSKARALRANDFEQALALVKPTGVAARNYLAKETFKTAKVTDTPHEFDDLD